MKVYGTNGKLTMKTHNNKIITITIEPNGIGGITLLINNHFAMNFNPDGNFQYKKDYNKLWSITRVNTKESNDIEIPNYL